MMRLLTSPPPLRATGIACAFAALSVGAGAPGAPLAQAHTPAKRVVPAASLLSGTAKAPTLKFALRHRARIGHRTTTMSTLASTFPRRILSGGSVEAGRVAGGRPVGMCMPTLSAVPDATANVSRARLYGVSGVSSDDVWAVGIGNGALTEHWNGVKWSMVPDATASSNAQGGFLSDVAALSANDVWAVGNTNSSGPGGTLVEHWNGTGWSVVPAIDPPSAPDPEFIGMSAAAPNDIWAVGTTNGSDVGQTLAEHWNGVRWIKTASVNPTDASDPTLFAVAAIAPNDVWAAGTTNAADVGATLFEHWNGVRWSVVTPPSTPDAADPYITGLAALGPNDVWAVGTTSGQAPRKTLIEHWNGSSWSVAPSANTNDSGRLYQVRALSANNVWAVGSDGSPLVEHWNGTAWALIPGPSPSGSVSSALEGLTTISAGDIWAVGLNGDRTLTEHGVDPSCRS